MATSITDIMDGIETRLATISGLRVNSEIPDQINPPEAVVGVPDISDYHETFGHGGVEIRPTVTVLTSRTLDRIGQRQLASYMDPTGTNSIHAPIEGERTLGGKVSFCVVESARNVQVKDANGIGYYGVEFTLYISSPGA